LLGRVEKDYSHTGVLRKDCERGDDRNVPGINGPRLRWVYPRSFPIPRSFFTTSVTNATRVRFPLQQRNNNKSVHKTLASPASNERVRCLSKCKERSLCSIPRKRSENCCVGVLLLSETKRLLKGLVKALCRVLSHHFLLRILREGASWSTL
jgi:hypothetical protein